MTCFYQTFTHEKVDKYADNLFGASQNAGLTRFIRLEIYNFLSLQEILLKVATLNKFERTFLESSSLMRENKKFSMELKSQKKSGNVRWVMISNRDELGEAMKEIPPRLVDYITRLVSELTITVDLYSNNKLDELSCLLVNLPKWFDKKGVSLALIDKPNQAKG